jgi:hypothetical protein
MRVGLITQLLWSRYGSFWFKLLKSAGLEPVYAQDERVRRYLSDSRLAAIPGTAFQLAAAQALALEADVIFAPDLNPGETSTIGGGQDPFIANFPDALRASLPGLPAIVAVPAALGGEGFEGLVVSTLMNLTHDPTSVRRAWERQRSAAKPPRLTEPSWRVQPSAGRAVGVIGQPWLLGDTLVRQLRLEQHAVSQAQLEPKLLREEGRRSDARLIGTDAEVLGAARFLGRKGNIGSLVMVTDEASGVDAWLVAQVQRSVSKPLEVVSLQRLGQAAPNPS